MNDEQLGAFDVFFERIYNGHTGASQLSFQLIQVSQTWDDLIDKDKPCTDKDINSAFINSLFTMQQNPLWHQCALSHHIFNVYLRWCDATAIETSSPSDDDLNKCYMLRAGMYDLFAIIAYHIGGDDWAAIVGPEIRRFYGEKLNEYKEQINHA